MSDDISSPRDEHLLGELRRVAAEADPVPSYVLDHAIASYAMFDLDVRLAALVADSLVDEPPALVRGPGSAPRTLSFDAAGTTIDLEVTERGDLRDLRGQVIAPTVGSVIVEHAGGEVAAEIDEFGQITISEVPAGRLRLRLRVLGEPDLVTSWVTV